MKPTMKKPASAADAFYAAPSPVRAVELAIADHKALNKFPMWEYVAQLHKACDRADAYPKLVARLRNLAGASCSDSAWWECEGLARHEGTGKTSAEIHGEVLEEARELLRELGEIA
jgi:hypothetical protein